MGTRVQVEIAHTDEARARAIIEQVMAEMHRVDHAFSPYKDTSEISKVNREAGLGWVSISDEMLDLLTKSRQISELTEGAFDITYASIGRYYDYREGQAPDDETVAKAIQAIDYQHIELQGNRVRFKHPAVYIDLGGIAKGHAVDRGYAILLANGITEGSVAAGGDSRILGDRLGKPWNVGVQHPRDPDKMAVLLPLIDTAVSTSGDYERYFERDGVRYHHILDPNTGSSSEYVILPSGSMMMASIPGNRFTSAMPFSGPKTNTLVDSPSVNVVSGPKIVTLQDPSADLPVLGSKMWW